MSKMIGWSERTISIALAVAITLIGIGPIPLAAGRVGISAWSVARTTLFFWFGLKLWIVIRERCWPFDSVPWARLAPLGLFFLIVTASLLVTFSQAGDYRYFAFACFHTVVVVEVVSDRQRLRWALLSLGVLPVVLVVRGLLHVPSVLAIDMSYRFGFPLDHPNTAGFVLAMTLPLSLWCIAAEKRWLRGLALVSCLLQLLALLLTYSRGAWIAAACSIVFYFVLSRQWKALTVIVAVGCVGVALVPTLRERLVSIARPMKDASIAERTMLAQQGIRIGWDNPLLGVGYGRGRVKAALREKFRGTTFEKIALTHSHNVYVELFAGTGFLGLVSYLWLVGSGFAVALRSALRQSVSEPRWGIALASAWLAVMVCGLGDVPFFHHETRILLFTLLGLTARAAALDALPERSNVSP